MKASVVRDAERERARARAREKRRREEGGGGKQQKRQKLRSRARIAAGDTPPALSTGAKDDHHRLQAHAFAQTQIIPHQSRCAMTCFNSEDENRFPLGEQGVEESKQTCAHWNVFSRPSPSVIDYWVTPSRTNSTRSLSPSSQALSFSLSLFLSLSLCAPEKWASKCARRSRPSWLLSRRWCCFPWA